MQVTSTARQAFRKAVLEGGPRLVEAMFLCQVSTASEALSGELPSPVQQTLFLYTITVNAIRMAHSLLLNSMKQKRQGSLCRFVKESQESDYLCCLVTQGVHFQKLASNTHFIDGAYMVAHAVTLSSIMKCALQA